MCSLLFSCLVYQVSWLSWHLLSSWIHYVICISWFQTCAELNSCSIMSGKTLNDYSNDGNYRPEFVSLKKLKVCASWCLVGSFNHICMQIFCLTKFCPRRWHNCLHCWIWSSQLHDAYDHVFNLRTNGLICMNGCMVTVILVTFSAA